MAREPVPDDVPGAAAAGGTVEDRAGVPVWTVVPYAVTASGMREAAEAEVASLAWLSPPEGGAGAPAGARAATEAGAGPGTVLLWDDAETTGLTGRGAAGTGSTPGAGQVTTGQAEDAEAPDPALELLGHRRPDFPAEAFAPIPTFVVGQPPTIDPAVAEAVFGPVESAAAHLFHDEPPPFLRRPHFEEPREVLPPLTLCEPAVPEPAVPEPTVPEPTVPEPTVPEPTVPTDRLRVLPPPADGVAVVHVVGMRKRCYRCGSETMVIAGLLAHDPAAEPVEDRVPTAAGWRRRDADVGPRYRFVRLSGVVELLASVLGSSWYDERGVAPLARREREASLRFTGEVVELANGCSVCDALLRSEPIEDAFENLVANTRYYDEYVLDTIAVPAVDLEDAPAW